MSRSIIIKAGEINVQGILNDSKTSDKIWESLPIESRGKVWGDEIYFDMFIEMGREDSKTVVKKGDICYWPLGSALCLFFGPTPVSTDGDIKPASPVNIVGRIEGDPAVLKGFKAGDRITVAKG